MLIKAYMVYYLSKIIKLINSRYYHVLKTHCLGGKHNRRVDYVIQALVVNFLPEIKTRHGQQLVNLEGPDLLAWRRRQILASAKKIPQDSIRQISNTQFFVASESRPGNYYPIDLNRSACGCTDFPRIRYCKHIAAINVHFPQLFPMVDSTSEIPEHVCVPDLPKRTSRSEEESAEILLKEINALCQQLNASNRSTLDLKALKGVKYSLSAAITLANGSWALPEKDVFHHNRNTWAETAGRMGAGKAPKRKPSRLVQTQAQSASALLKASAAINIVTCMLQERDRASVPSPMRSLPLQMNALECLLCPPQAPVYFPLHARPLPLQR